MTVRTASVTTIWIGILYAWLGVVFGPGWRDFAIGFAIIGAGWLTYGYTQLADTRETLRHITTPQHDDAEEQAA